jgi:hypothetical protein
MAETRKKDRDIVTPIAVTAGAVAVGAGLYFYMKKPKGVDPGDVIMASFSFDYYGNGGSYILQVSLGNLIVGGWFDHVEGLTWTLDIMLPKPEEVYQRWTFNVPCPLPQAVEPGTYDAEAMIKLPGMGDYDYIDGTKVLTENAINIRKE